MFGLSKHLYNIVLAQTLRQSTVNLTRTTFFPDFEKKSLYGFIHVYCSEAENTVLSILYK